MDKAIILAAGEGKRLRPLTNLKPKCLLELNGTTILEHQLRNLEEYGIREVVITVGYHAELILRNIRRRKPGLNVRFIQNPIFDKTNTVYSLWLAREETRTDFLYLNGDVVFHKQILARLVDAECDAALAINKKKVGQEEVKVELVSDRVKAIGKDIDPSRAKGEFVGIARFSRKFNVLFREKLDEVVEEGKIDVFFEEALNRTLSDSDHYRVCAVDVSDLPCIEIDTRQDYDAARDIYARTIKTI